MVEVPIEQNAGVGGPKATLTRSPGMVKKIINVDPENMPAPEEARNMKKIGGLHLRASHQLYGSHVELVKGSGGKAAVVRAQEALWEHTRGHKVDGGERRKAEVRAKRRAAENRATRT